MTTPRIYIADLAAYNSGILHGLWVEACDDPSDIWAQIKQMLASSPIAEAEEIALHDYEGFCGVEIGEYTNIETAHEIACFVEEHETLGALVLVHFCEDIIQATTAIEEDYCGCFSKPVDFAQQLTKQTTPIPAALAPHIDYERIA